MFEGTPIMVGVVKIFAFDSDKEVWICLTLTKPLHLSIAP